MKRIFPAIIAAVILLSSCSPKAQTFTFVQLSDPQLRFTRDTGIEGVSAFQLDSIHLEKAIERVNGLKPDFVVITGDLVNDPGNGSDQKAYLDLLAKFSPDIPVYNVPGNHDIRDGADNDQIESYIARYGYDRFSFDHKGSKFIGIDYNVIRSFNEIREQEQFQWLSDELAAAKKKKMPVYVFTHCPVFLNTIDEAPSYNAFPPETRAKYWELFKDGGVKAVIAGHLHYNSTTEFEGIQTVITGPTGYSFEDGGDKEGFRIWTVNPDSFSSEFIYLK